MVQTKVLHFLTKDPHFGEVPTCWNEDFTFSRAQLTPFIDQVECKDCLLMVKQAQEANP